MRRAIKYITMMLITIEITLICLFLPSELSKWQDRQSFGSIHLEKAEEIKVEQNQQLTMLEKLSLFSNPKNTANRITIKQGKYLKEEDIPQVCKREIKQLEKLGIIKDMDVNIELDTLQTQQTYYLSNNDPTKSMIVWDVTYINGTGYVSISLDDETGKILSLTEKTKEQIVNTDVDTFIKELGQYYGVDVYNYGVKRMPPYSEKETKNQVTFASVIFSEGKNKLSCGIQIYPIGWYYLDY